MRVTRWFVTTALAASVLTLATPARADGGAYISLDETYYVSGNTAHAEGYVWIPEKKRDILDRGPFYAYLIPPKSAYLSESRPLPPGTIRVGTFDIEPFGKEEIELSVTFTIPSVATGTYTMQLCNEPCTVAGFREPQTGQLTIAATATEAQLLRERDRLNDEIWSVKSKLKRAGRDADELQAQLDDAVAEGDRYALQIAELQAQGTALSTPGAVMPTSAANDDRPMIDAWALVTIGGGFLVVLLTIALAVVFSRRQAPRLTVPDTIAELEVEIREPAQR
jgi:hypothetical protein